MALASGPSTSLSYSSIRYPVRIRTSTPAHPSTILPAKARVSFAPSADTPPPPHVSTELKTSDTTITDTPPPPPVTIEFEIPYTTIDLFLRSEMFSLAKSDTPPASLVLNDVPATALPAIRFYLECTGKHVKYVLAPPLSP